jgi:hypothetical protein
MPYMPSRLGWLIDRATYTDLVVFGCAAIVVSSLYFWLAPDGQGMDPKGGKTFLDALYLSIVTFTTLGYGDVVPIGFGRLVAILVVGSGLFTTALVIGKMASERQFSLLLLLHTSDIQRRISGFRRELVATRESTEAAHAARNCVEVKKHVKSLNAVVRSVSSYLSFNSFQAKIFEFGNFSSLMSLYDELDEAFDLCETLALESQTYGDATITRRSLSTCWMIHDLVRLMHRFHAETVSRTSLLASLALKCGYERLFRSNRGKPAKLARAEDSTARHAKRLYMAITPRVARLGEWKASAFHPIQVERVLREFPTGLKTSWGTGLHKSIAAKLKISNTVTAKCIECLLKTGELPKV